MEPSRGGDSRRTSGEFDTIIQHLGEDRKFGGAVVRPIFQNSLYTFESCEDLVETFAHEVAGTPDKFAYGRHGHPNLELVECKLAAMEKTEAARVFCSGMAAISAAVLSCVQAGAHVVYVDTVYGPTRRLFEEFLPRFGVSSTAVSGLCTDEVFDACRPETKLIFLESPSSFVMRLQDLGEIAAEARRRGIVTAIDGSYATPLLQNPAELGIDLVLHSATKYLNGHSDVIAGVVCGSRERIVGLNRLEAPLLGALLPPFPAWLLLRGLRTLTVRMPRHAETANRLAAMLEEAPQVEQVFHVGSKSFGQNELFAKQMRGPGGLFSFVPKTRDMSKIHDFLCSLEMFQIGVSWGGFESLALAFEVPAIGWPEPKPVVRLFCGLENPDDLEADLRQALPKLD